MAKTASFESGGIVKPLPPPNVPGKTEFDRIDNAMRQVLTVSKAEL
jgi:hypothetical protein